MQKELPKARLIDARWSSRWLRPAKFRCANFMRLHLGWVVIEWRMPWLPHSAKTLYGVELSPDTDFTWQWDRIFADGATLKNSALSGRQPVGHV